MKILIITDSLGLPRSVPEKVMPEETWPEILAKQYEIIKFSMGGATVKELYTQVAYLEMYAPEIVFIQAGIVDCAPRALCKLERDIINSNRFARGAFKKILTPTVIRFLRNHRNVTYTSIVDFKMYSQLFASKFSRVHWIEIMTPTATYERTLPGITKNVVMFNASLEEIYKHNLIKMPDRTTQDLLSDQIHLSSSGHSRLYEIIKKKIESYEDNC